jgi:hypothetical protein
MDTLERVEYSKPISGILERSNMDFSSSAIGRLEEYLAEKQKGNTNFPGRLTIYFYSGDEQLDLKLFIENREFISKLIHILESESSIDTANIQVEDLLWTYILEHIGTIGIESW